MLKNARLVLVLLACVAFLATAVAAEEAANSYVGLKKCSMCHKKDATGNQFGIWSESPHAKAFTVLSSEAGLAKAKELGVENPAAADACLKCHATAHGVSAELGGEALAMEEGVTCESCHGAGSAYYKKATMEGITAGTIDGATVGLTKITAETCTKCHMADNPGHKGEFNFEEAVKLIAHPIPASE